MKNLAGVTTATVSSTSGVKIPRVEGKISTGIFSPWGGWGKLPTGKINRHTRSTFFSLFISKWMQVPTIEQRAFRLSYLLMLPLLMIQSMTVIHIKVIHRKTNKKKKNNFTISAKTHSVCLRTKTYLCFKIKSKLYFYPQQHWSFWQHSVQDFVCLNIHLVQIL